MVSYSLPCQGRCEGAPTTIVGGFLNWSLAPSAFLVHPNCFCCLPESSETDIMLFCLVRTNWVLFLSVISQVIQEKNYMGKLTMTYKFRLHEASRWPTPSWEDKDRQPLLSASAKFVPILQMSLFPRGIVSKLDCSLQSANLDRAESAENDKCWKQCGWDLRSPQRGCSVGSVLQKLESLKRFMVYRWAFSLIFFKCNWFAMLS